MLGGSTRGLLLEMRVCRAASSLRIEVCLLALYVVFFGECRQEGGDVDCERERFHRLGPLLYRLHPQSRQQTALKPSSGIRNATAAVHCICGTTSHTFRTTH